MEGLGGFGTGVMEHTTAILLAGIIASLAGWAWTAIRGIREKQLQERLRIASYEAVQAELKKAQEEARNARSVVTKEFRQKYEAALPTLARALADLIMQPITNQSLIWMT